MAKKSKKGFSLAELLIVVAIIAVLVAISIPIFTSQLKKARLAVDHSAMRDAYALAQIANNMQEIEIDGTIYSFDDLKSKQINNDNKKVYFVLSEDCNHLIILMEEGTEPLAKIFKRIGDRFVYWYNRKYKRIGPLFQDCFRSEPVETERYFLTVVRYIFQNPVKAGIVSAVNQYKWCNYSAYCGENDFTDTDKVLSFFSETKDFISFVNEESSEECLDVCSMNSIQITDEIAQKLVTKISGCKNASEFQKLERNNRNFYIQELRKAGLSIRQISRLTGVSKSVVGSVSNS